MPRVVVSSVALLVVAAVVVSSVVTVGPDDQRRDVAVFKIDQRLGSAAVRAVRSDSKQPVVVVPGGSMAALSVAPAITAKLAAEGIDFQVPANQADAYGTRRTFDPGKARSALVVVSSFGPLPKVPGRRLGMAYLNPELVPVVDRLLRQARSGPIVKSAKAHDLEHDFLPSLAYVASVRIGRLHSSPYAALTTIDPLNLLVHGYLTSPSSITPTW